MIRQLILIVFVAATFVSADPLYRRRRQSGSGSDSAPSSISLPCPIGCSWQSSLSWAKAISFGAPTINMVDNPATVNTSDTFSIMCSIYKTYQQCMGKCDVSTDADRQAVSAVASYDQVCASRQADFDKALPCLTNNTSLFQSTCKSENEELLAANVRLMSKNQWTPTETSRFCDYSNRQLYCIFPIVRQTCGDDSYNLIRSIANASVAGLEAYIGKEAIQTLYPSCDAYLNTLADGIAVTQTSTVSTSAPTTTVNSTTTMATSFFNTTTVNSTSTVRLRDDPIPYGVGEGLGLSGTNPPSTTPSGASKINFNYLFAFFIFSMLFL